MIGTIIIKWKDNRDHEWKGNRDYWRREKKYNYVKLRLSIRWFWFSPSTRKLIKEGNYFLTGFLVSSLLVWLASPLLNKVFSPSSIVLLGFLLFLSSSNITAYSIKAATIIISFYSNLILSYKSYQIQRRYRPPDRGPLHLAWMILVPAPYNIDCWYSCLDVVIAL